MHSSQQCSVQRVFCNIIHIQLRLVTTVRGLREGAQQKPSRIDRIVMRFAARVAASQIFPLVHDRQGAAARFESIG
ncbi:hypothetical protein PCAR4_190081 [Paraburkholderia caribensis]|nr:hypothetical protein PCAR4_190081 [Paraburkholderia caribensis]